ncbi:MAG: DNA damage-inducible protein D [Planctomycetes bacterium]|nr:DNA damage-inducible protein D [Planctomycetota bacterium]
MHQDLITKLFRAFEDLLHHEGETDFWLARELQALFGYTKWRNFEQVVDKARAACAQAGAVVTDHFADVGKMVALGSGARRRIEDVAVTRYGAYLIAMNGDPRKDVVAFAQTYFALQTRRQELVERRLAEVERLEARRRLTASEKELSGVIFERLREQESFARIRSKGDAALFGGWTTRDMNSKLGVPSQRALADFLPTITIKTKDLANEMTTHNVKAYDLQTESVISSDHSANNRELREALGKRGIRPEDLPAEEDVRAVDRRLARETRRLPEQVGRLDGGIDADSDESAGSGPAEG